VAKERIEVRQDRREGPDQRTQPIEEVPPRGQPLPRGGNEWIDAARELVEVRRQFIDLLQRRPERPSERPQLRDDGVGVTTESCEAPHRVRTLLLERRKRLERALDRPVAARQRPEDLIPVPDRAAQLAAAL